MENLLAEHIKRKSEIRQRLQYFKSIRPEDYFYELCFCVLTPQTSARRGDKAISLLKEKKFHEKKINAAPILQSIVRFHNHKAKYLDDVKKNYSVIFEKIKNTENSFELRNWLAENIKGIGLKESSHFLRNIGHENLAILDRHILKNLAKYRVIKEAPKSLTRNKYLEIEEKFKEFGKDLNIPMDELDLLFWSHEAGEVFK